MTAAGTGLPPVQLAGKPNDCDPPAVIEPFPLASVTVTVGPLWVTEP